MQIEHWLAMKINMYIYRIVDTNILDANAEYPGQPIQWSDDGGETWTDYTENTIVNPGTIQIITKCVPVFTSFRLRKRHSLINH
jgi:hypothetical protein